MKRLMIVALITIGTLLTKDERDGRTEGGGRV
jgi:hypothetical protein